MQFYILHEDPETSARLLPDYALKQVNIREGWQILSDIGHIHGITWSGQNKLYSASHALTRQLCSTVEMFQEFINNYRANLYEYERRFGNITSYHSKADNFLRAEVQHDIYNKLSRDKYENTIQYLLAYKVSKLTTAEIARLTNERICISKTASVGYTSAEQYLIKGIASYIKSQGLRNANTNTAL